LTDGIKIIKIMGVEVGETSDYNDVFVVLELMETDLHAIVKSGQQLTDPHLQYFIYQLARGLKYIHSAGIIHRDLKTGNLLVNSDCEMKICDFGLARQKGNTGFMTEYVATRWYRAPEVMMTSGDYTAAMDMWSVGCILAEFLGGKPLFKGRTCTLSVLFSNDVDLDTLNQMIGVLGTPDEETLQRVVTTPETSSRILSYIKTLKWCPKVPLSTKFPDANPLAVALLERLLRWDPKERPTVDQVLADPWLREFHDLADEPVCISAVELPFDNVVENRATVFGDVEKTQLRGTCLLGVN
jgi:mitogen-activated protein kinase 7